MAELIFYTNPMSRGQIARWALEEAGAKYEQVLLEYGTAMKADDFLAINPMGKVPAIRHRGKVITEAAAICLYLAEAFPDAGLLPNEGERADYYRWTFFCAGPLEQAITDKHFGITPSEQQERMAGYGNLERAIAALEGAVSDRKFICGDRFTMADVYVGSQVDWGLQFKTLPELEGFTAYAGRVRNRDAYRRAKAIDAKLIEEAQSVSA